MTDETEFAPISTEGVKWETFERASATIAPRGWTTGTRRTEGTSIHARAPLAGSHGLERGFSHGRGRVDARGRAP
jgi:hypothetical protein